MMETKEWRSTDKTAWSAGPWHDEPDKAQWQDEATGLPCLIVRNPCGALCGYVGVAEGHPLHGKDYSSAATLPKETAAQLLDARGVADLYADDLETGEVSVEALLSAHGGITFADFCSDHSREAWEKFRAHKAAWELEAQKYPVGDAARRMRDWAGTFDDYGAWLLRKQATSICHLPAPGEPDRVWWFGFDCAHAGDLSPGMESLLPSRFWGDGEYRDLAYVKDQCAGLARQFAAIGAQS